MPRPADRTPLLPAAVPPAGPAGEPRPAPGLDRLPELGRLPGLGGFPGVGCFEGLMVGVGLGQGAGGLRVPGRDPEGVREAVREVLSRPEFRPPERSLLERAVDWVLEVIGRLLGALAGSGAGGIVGLLLLALVLVGVGVLAARFSRGLTPGRELAAAVAAGRRRSAAEWRAEAEALERAGAWREAVRSRYRALVADLAARGLVEEVPGRTAGEYRREVRRAAPAAATDFAGATELFEVAWYGRADTGAREAAHLRDLSDRILQQARA